MKQMMLLWIAALGMTVLGQNNIAISGAISADAIWAGNVVISGDIIVQRGVTLKIMPGTKILIMSRTDALASGEQPDHIEIIVLGQLIAEGKSGNQKIVFTSASPVPQMHDWYGIVFKTRGSASVLKHVLVEYAYSGVTCYGSSPTIENSTLQYNYYVGINCQVRSNPVIRNSMIIANGFAGLNCELAASPVVENCIISQNNQGVIIYDRSNPDLGRKTPSPGQSSGGNHLFNNFEFNIYNRSRNTINTQNNFWNTETSAAIRATLFDKNQNQQYGEVIFEPVLPSSASISSAVRPTAPATDLATAQPPTQTTRQAETRPQPNSQTSQPPARRQNSQPTSSRNDAATPNTPTVLAANTPPNSVANGTQTTPTQSSSPATGQPDNETVDTKNDSIMALLSLDNAATAGTDNATRPTPQPAIEPGAVNQPVIELFLDGGRRQYIRRKSPDYPPGYRRAGVEGLVLLEVIVSRDGRVQNARVLRSDGDAFADAARDALNAYRYKPGTRNGRAVAYKIVERFEFKLTNN